MERAPYCEIFLLRDTLEMMLFTPHVHLATDRRCLVGIFCNVSVEKTRVTGLVTCATA